MDEQKRITEESAKKAINEEDNKAEIQERYIPLQKPQQRKKNAV